LSTTIDAPAGAGHNLNKVIITPLSFHFLYKVLDISEPVGNGKLKQHFAIRWVRQYNFFKILNINQSYIYFGTQIWLGECNQRLLKVKDSSCVCREVLTFNVCLLNLNRFCVKNHLLNLCSIAVNEQRLLYSQKAGVKYSY
jgi:hypothetical protein